MVLADDVEVTVGSGEREIRVSVCGGYGQVRTMKIPDHGSLAIPGNWVGTG